MAKHKFKVARTIARVNNPKNEDIFKKLGIDCTIGVTNLILKHIEEELPAHPLTHLLTMAEEGAEIVEIKIEKNSKIINKAVKEIKLPKDSVLALLIRNGEKPQVPTADTILKADDRIIALTSMENEASLRKTLVG